MKVTISIPKVAFPIGFFVWIIFGYFSGMCWSDYVFSDFGLTHWSNIWVYFWLFLWPFGWFWHLFLPMILVIIVVVLLSRAVYLLGDRLRLWNRVRGWNVNRMCRNTVRRALRK